MLNQHYFTDHQNLYCIFTAQTRTQILNHIQRTDDNYIYILHTYLYGDTDHHKTMQIRISNLDNL